MRDLAEHLGISHATVSRALRDDPRITEAVRRRVWEAANRLGYRRDPRLAELMSYVRGSRQRAFRGTLAWITDLDMADAHQRWLQGLNFGPASERAGELGYKLEAFTRASSADAPRLERELKARGVRGIGLMFFFSKVNLEDWKWDWGRFAFVHSGTIPFEPLLDIVDADYTANSQLLFATLAQRGYRRIGVAVNLNMERCLNYATCAAGDLFARLDPNHPMFAPCLLREISAATTPILKKWIRRHRVDCVITTAVEMRDVLTHALGYRLPFDLGLVSPGVDPKGNWSGINQRDELIAKTVVETLATAVERGRFGIPDCPRRILLRGVWHQGATCR